MQSTAQEWNCIADVWNDITRGAWGKWCPGELFHLREDLLDHRYTQRFVSKDPCHFLILFLNNHEAMPIVRDSKSVGVGWVIYEKGQWLLIQQEPDFNHREVYHSHGIGMRYAGSFFICFFSLFIWVSTRNTCVSHTFPKAELTCLCDCPFSSEVRSCMMGNTFRLTLYFFLSVKANVCIILKWLWNGKKVCFWFLFKNLYKVRFLMYRCIGPFK